MKKDLVIKSGFLSNENSSPKRDVRTYYRIWNPEWEGIEHPAEMGFPATLELVRFRSLFVHLKQHFTLGKSQNRLRKIGKIIKVVVFLFKSLIFSITFPIVCIRLLSALKYKFNFEIQSHLHWLYWETGIKCVIQNTFWEIQNSLLRSPPHSTAQ